MRKLLVSAAILAHLHLGHGSAAAQSTEEIIDTITERAEAHGVSAPWMVGIAWCESRFNRWAVGARGEQGLFQLNPRGIGGRFWALGYTDMGSIWQQADFTALMLSQGNARHWSCA